MSWIRKLPLFSENEIAAVAKAYRLHGQSPALWLTVKSVLTGYAEPITVRQLYYQLVARGYIENSQRAYKNLVSQLSRAREAGFIPWDSFVDRSRAILAGDRANLMTRSPEDVARSQVRGAFESRAYIYELPIWWGQPIKVEVWTEKDALSGVLEPICSRMGVRLVVSKGYTSYTYRREAEQRFNGEKEAVILYFGDLDPTGVDIPRMLAEDLPQVEVKRIALLPSQVGGLPPNPVKETDTRFKQFLARYPELGGKCYELDALPPQRLRELCEQAILEHFDPRIAEERDRREREWRGKYEAELERQKEKLLKADALEDDEEETA
ncbi:MAG: hypothetical protein J7J22_00015 [Candidatus Verstraetearchaeota archaeon]|nr:hypothetical protein [Candidatus Verstraetearchaeota archaeon]